MMKWAPFRTGLWIGVAAGLALLLAGCGPTVVYRDRVVSVNVPVPTPCAAERPAKVEPLKARYPDAAWADMDVRQKAAAAGRQALYLRGHGEQLDAATAGCL